MNDRNQIVTPYTDPDRWTEEEKAIFDAGRCPMQEFPSWGAPAYCRQPSKPGASFGHCADHEAEFAELYWPDGSVRR